MKKIKIEELMLGDWVKLTNSKGECIDYSQLDENLFCISIRDGEDGCLQFSPIPLTEEILEKNGFDKHDNRFVYKEYKLEICIEKYEDDDIVLSIGHTCNGGYDGVHVRIHHVHELQHALRLFGLGDIANNFKIKTK